MSNLLDNALRYAPREATITVCTSRADSTITSGVTVAVHNTGPGISPEELPHMCERFYRGEAARDYKVPGAGLGLAIAQTIMRLLNGLLTVDSSPGQGITFTFWLS